MQTKAKIFGLASFCAHVNVPDLWCSFPLPPCYYHSRQWSPMHSTHTQATCQYLVDRYSSISDSPAASFCDDCDINFFANFDVASRWITTIWTFASSLHTSHEQPTVLPYHPCCRSNRYGGWICSGLIDGGFMIHRMWMLVHHRHRVVPRHQRRRPCIVHIDVSPQPIPSDTDWYKW